MGNRWTKPVTTVAVPAAEEEEGAVPAKAPPSRKVLKVVIVRACHVDVERIYLNGVADPKSRKPGFAIIHRRCSTVHVWVVPHACAAQISDYVQQLAHRAHGIMIMCDETQDIRDIVTAWQYYAIAAPRHAIVVSTKLRLQQVARAFDQLFRLLEGCRP